MISLLLFLALAAGGTVGLWQGLGLHPLVSWFLCVNVVTFGAYGYDKSIAGSRRSRIPEKTLLVLGAIGGTLGALCGMFLLHHKTSKRGYQFRFWVIVAIQVLLVVSYFIWLLPYLERTGG